MHGLFAVPMPELPKGQGEARTRARIGRKVARLFGVPDPASTGEGRTPSTSYAALTMNELLLGGPMVMKDPPDGIADTGIYQRPPAGQRAMPEERSAHGDVIADGPISPTLVRGYGPDPKAAVVLTGANVVLRPLTQALIAVLTRMRFPDTRLLVGTTAMLLSEAMRSQPVLVLAGVQASRVQRALYLEDAVELLAAVPSADEPWRVSRLDLPWARLERTPASASAGVPASPVPPPIREKDLCPIHLEMVTSVWAALIDSASPARLVPRPTNMPRFEQPRDVSQISLIRETALAAARDSTERVVFGLGNDAAGTRIVLRYQPDGDFYVDFPGIATRPARVLADRLLGSYFETDSRPAMGQRSSPSTPVLTFDPGMWDHEPPLVQRVALWAHHCAERFVVSGAWSETEPHRSSFDARTEQRQTLVQTATRYFGVDDPLVAQLRVFHASYRLEQERRRLVAAGVPPLPDASAVVDQFESAARTMIKISRDKRVLDSHFVESLQTNLFDLASFKNVTTGELSATVSRLLEDFWSAYLDAQLRLLAPPHIAHRHASQLLENLAAEGADQEPYLRAVLESSPFLATGVAMFQRDDATQLAIRIQENATKRREAIYEIEGDWPPLRQAKVDEAWLKMVRFKQLTRQESDLDAEAAERDKAINDVLQIVKQVVSVELVAHGAKPEASGLVPGFPEDALLFTLSEYLLLAKKYSTLDRETGGLKQDILSAVRQFGSCIPSRLARHPWLLPDLERHRAVLLEALSEQG